MKSGEQLLFSCPTLKKFLYNYLVLVYVPLEIGVELFGWRLGGDLNEDGQNKRRGFFR